MNYISIDNGERLNIESQQARKFELTLKLNKATAGHTYQLQIIDDADAVVLTFNQADGITVDSDALLIEKTTAQMAEVPTGVYRYSLVELTRDEAVNLLSGYFIIKPPTPFNIWPSK